MIQVLPDLEAVSRAAAELLVNQAREAIRDRGQFSLVLSGGHTPRRLYELLSSDPFRDQISWERVHIFWTDERCVPPDDPRSNERMARRSLLDHVPIPPLQIHPIHCTQRVRDAAVEYESLLRTFFKDGAPRFDFVLLGLGEDGHTASLFPNTNVLEERERWVAGLYVDEQDLHRITLTVPIINQAAVVAFLVSGASKARILHEVLEGPSDPHRLPAQFIRPISGKLIWLVDEESAMLLKHI
ncbi:MAG: 6-phosphogluconolactonase [Bacteroidota bacterium]|jgi:6-phosphogluconolactonase